MNNTISAMKLHRYITALYGRAAAVIIIFFSASATWQAEIYANNGRQRVLLFREKTDPFALKHSAEADKKFLDTVNSFRGIKITVHEENPASNRITALEYARKAGYSRMVATNIRLKVITREQRSDDILHDKYLIRKEFIHLLIYEVHLYDAGTGKLIASASKQSLPVHLDRSAADAGFELKKYFSDAGSDRPGFSFSIASGIIFPAGTYSKLAGSGSGVSISAGLCGGTDPGGLKFFPAAGYYIHDITGPGLSVTSVKIHAMSEYTAIDDGAISISPSIGAGYIFHALYDRTKGTSILCSNPSIILGFTAAYSLSPAAGIFISPGGGLFAERSGAAYYLSLDLGIKLFF